jgi:hypothetical protein
MYAKHIHTSTHKYTNIHTQDVIYWESQYADDWKIALTVTEFLVAPSLRQRLVKIDSANKSRHMYVIGGFDVIGKRDHDGVPVLKRFAQLAAQRTIICREDYATEQRFMHVGYREGEYMYVPGRHHMQTAVVDPVPAVLQVCMYVCMYVCAW